MSSCCSKQNKKQTIEKKKRAVTAEGVSSANAGKLNQPPLHALWEGREARVLCGRGGGGLSSVDDICSRGQILRLVVLGWGVANATSLTVDAFCGLQSFSGTEALQSSHVCLVIVILAFPHNGEAVRKSQACLEGARVLFLRHVDLSVMS